MATSQPPTDGPLRRAAMLLMPIRIGVRLSFSSRRATVAAYRGRLEGSEARARRRRSARRESSYLVSKGRRERGHTLLDRGRQTLPKAELRAADPNEDAPEREAAHLLGETEDTVRRKRVRRCREKRKPPERPPHAPVCRHHPLE